jgi:uncharacterized protein (DUF697 family)
MQRGGVTYREMLDKAIAGDFDSATEEEKGRVVGEAIRLSATRAAVVALQPLPLVDSAVLTPLQLRMVAGIARIRGCRDREPGLRILGRLFESLVTPHLTMAGMKVILFVPILPDLVAASVAYALTWALGEVSDEFFRADRAPTDEELRARFDDLYRRKLELTYRERRDEVKARLRSLAP